MAPIDDSGLATFFAALGAAQGTAGPIGELTAHLATGNRDPLVYREVRERHGFGAEPWFQAQRLDIVLAYARACSERGRRLSDGQLAELRALRSFLHVRDGEFAENRPAEVASIVREQVEEILADAVINDAEDVYQVEFQAAFGLGYDDYLSMARIVFERVWSDLQREESAGNGSPAERKRAALGPIVRMATARARTSGALLH